jgi:phosphate transport system permease protein
MGVKVLGRPVEVDEVAPDAPAMPIPTLTSRLAGAALEPAIFLMIALAVYVVEYFLAGPLIGFGPSNFLIAFALMCAWNGWQYAGSQTVHGATLGHFIATVDGAPASTITIIIRQAIRLGLLYGIPFALFDGHLGATLLVAGATGLFIRGSTAQRGPWDLIAGTTVIAGFPTSTKLELAPIKTAADLRLDGKRRLDERRARRLLLGAGLFSVLASALIVWAIFSEAAEFVLAEEFEWSVLTGIGWFPRRGIFDLSTLFVGTLWITGIAMVVAGPVGLGVAIYLSEYASPRVRRFLKPLIETLASIPSVVVGLFAISFIAPKVLQPMFGDIGIFSLLAAGLGVGVLTVPIVASISEDAMRAVPQELREASYGLGSRRATTALRVVFPAALSGISAAFIVGISRAIGETMVVFIAAGGSGGAIFETNPTEPGQAITAAMASLGAGTDSVAGSGIAFQSLYFLGALLFVITLLMNVVSDRIVRRFRQVY